MILAAFVQVMSYAAIVLDEPVIGNDYMKFSGQCAEHNWKFVLDTYEWADRGPQFQLTITPMDAAQDAYFTSEDLADQNYWEPLFRKYTKQLAKEEMEACESIKKIFITDVRLSEGQFRGYATDALNVLEINATGDYTIPAYCFGTSSTSTTTNSLKLKQFYCNVNGTLTIGTDVFPTNSGSMTIYTTKETLAQQWYDYKTSNGHDYTVYLNGTQYNGGGSSGGAAIVLDEPVIGNDYMKFSGQCAEHNWKFVLDTYEWADKGPQFQLIITPMDVAQDAYFTSDDLADENYWEPMFRKYTKQMAGQEMEACNNVKKLFITNVRLVEGQFKGYATSSLNVLEINASGNYTIPNQCFGSLTDSESLKLKQFNCNVDGTLTIGSNVFPTNSASMTIYCTTETLAQQWYDYKTSNGHGYTVYLNGTQYNGNGSSGGGGTSSTDVITNMKLTIRHNGGDAFTQEFPASGFATVDLTDEMTSSLIINKVEAAAPDDMSEVSLLAAVYNSGSSADKWITMPLTKQGNGTWLLTVPDSEGDLIKNEKETNTKIFEFYLKATDSQGNSVYYNNGGQNYKVTYKIAGGESSDWKIKVYSENTAVLGLKINGEDWSTSYTSDAIRERYYGWNPGEVSSLAIDNFSLSFIRNDDVSIDNVKLKYRVYEDDATGGDWTSITANLTNYEDIYNKNKDVTEHYMCFSASNLSTNVTSGLESGKGYVLELYYKVTTTDGSTIDFGKDKDGMKFYFSIAESSEVILGDVNGDGSITMADANMVVNYFLATDPSSIANFNVAAADVNGDKAITMADANQIVNMFLGQ